MHKIKMIAGLGNPLQKYNNTRHNVGIWYIESLSRFFNLNFKDSKKFSGYISEFFFYKKKLYYLFQIFL